MTNATLDTIISFIAKQTGKDASEISASTTMEDVGLDSLDFIEMVFQIEETFNIHVDHNQNDVANRLQTVGDIADLIDELVAAKSAKPSDGKSEAA